MELLRNKNFSSIELESILNLFTQPVLLVNQEDEITLVNSALIEMTAFSKQELLKTPLRSLVIEEKSDSGKILYKILRKNKTALTIELNREFLDDKQA